MIPELLAPAGNIEILKAAAMSGADAVYFGGDLYGARAFAGNLSHDEVLEAISFLHTHGKKAYLTVNTLLKNREIEEGLFSYLRDFYEAGLDAVLVQDLGVLSFLRGCFPDLTIHASTQMCVSSPYGYEFLKKLGVARAVPARELSIDEIRTLSAVPGIETEVFVHGAMCVCYSGRCYLSGLIGGRSANRGRCGQPCRLPYTGTVDGEKAKLPGGGKYPVSMKDLYGLPLLQELCRAGVDSLKIEGRMKSKEYVTGVVSVYRKYLDLLAEEWAASEETSNSSEKKAGKEDAAFSFEPADMDYLRALGNRGNFAHVYYEKNNSPEMISFSDSSFHSDPAALAMARAASGPSEGSFVAEMKPVGPSVNMAFTARAGSPMQLSASAAASEGRVFSVTVTGDLVESAAKKATSEAEVREKLSKLGGTGFAAGTIAVELGDNVFLPMSKVNSLRREAVERLQEEMKPAAEKKKPVCPPEDFFARTEETLQGLKDTLQNKSGKAKQTEGRAAVQSANNEGLPELYISIMNLDQLSGLDTLEEPVSLIIPAFLLIKDGAVELLQAQKAKGRKVCLSLPYVFRKRLLPFEKELKERADRVGIDEYFVSQVDSLQYLLDAGIPVQKITGDNDLYVFNRAALAFYAGLGIRRYSAPFELNGGELSHLLPEAGILTLYGRTPIMKMANCLLKNTGRCEEKKLREKDSHSLSYIDRKGASVPVVRDCMNCINILYNSVPMILFGDLTQIGKAGYSGYRLDFTTETAEEVRDILSAFQKALFGEKEPLPGAHTRGHYKRGVE